MRRIVSYAVRDGIGNAMSPSHQAYRHARLEGLLDHPNLLSRGNPLPTQACKYLTKRSIGVSLSRQRGVLKKALMAHLRTTRQMRQAKGGTTKSGLGQIVDAASIRERPADQKRTFALQQTARYRSPRRQRLAVSEGRVDPAARTERTVRASGPIES